MAGPSEQPVFTWQPPTPGRRSDRGSGSIPTGDPRRNLLLGAGAGLVAGVIFRAGATAPGEDGPFTILISVFIVAAIVVTALAIGILQRRVSHLPALMVFFLAAGIGGVLGPENARALHETAGHLAVRSLPGGFAWSGDARCVRAGIHGVITDVEATVPTSDGALRVVVGMLDGRPSPTSVDGVVGVGAAGLSSYYEVRIDDSNVSADGSSGKVTSWVFPSSPEQNALGPFAGCRLAAEWSCDLL